MRCSDFLTNYSDFRDQSVASPALRHRLVRHLAKCKRCSRYNEVIDWGIDRLRAAPAPEASARFSASLRDRLAASVLDAVPLFPVPVRYIGSLVVATTVAALVIGGLTDDGRKKDLRSPPERPMPMVRANPSPPFVTFADLAAPTSFGRTTSVEFGYATYAPPPPPPVPVTNRDTVARD